MKNVIFLLVDSVYSACLGRGRTDTSSTPFIDSLVDNAVYADSVYSYGPYTDAATRGLLCGNPTLNDYGYFYGINSPDENHFKTFHDSGYETIGLYYPYYLIGSKVRQYIDLSVFIGGFVYKSEWFGKFKYYAERQKQNPLIDVEYQLLFKHLDLMFDCWHFFYKEIEQNKLSGILARDFAEPNSTKKCKQALEVEIERYRQDRRAYTDEVLRLGMEHPLAFIDHFSFDNAISTACISKVYANHKKFFRRVASKEFWLNLKNNKISLKKAIKSKRYLVNYGCCLLANRYMRNLSVKPEWQYSSSMYKQICATMEAIDNRTDTTKPFYAYMHVEEPHNYIACFSYDVCDQKVIDEEIAYLTPIVEGCGKKFKGSLTYQLSLGYVDLCVKRLFAQLQCRGLLENTTIVITSDHGSSYSFYPVRETVVNCFHRENYQTPLLIWNSDVNEQEKGVYKGIYSAEDTLPTILHCLNLPCPERYMGKPIPQNRNGRPYAITEYMGPGAPDMRIREVWMSIRNEEYVLAFKQPIYEHFSVENCVEVYNLRRDPMEKHNIREGFDFALTEGLVDAIVHRFTEIQKETNALLENIDAISVLKEENLCE